MKNIVILGSTGSIGMQALDVISKKRNEFTVAGLSCHSNIDLLERQIRQFEAKTAAVFVEDKARELRRRIGIKVLSGIDGMAELAAMGNTDLVINALVGSVGITPTIAAIASGNDVALANKETLVSAGKLVMSLARTHGTTLFPIDSEHSAIFQCMNGERKKHVKRIIITCSGGAFRERAREDLSRVTPDDALKHPCWDMGSKITIDSATLMNKGFEVIEANMLFDIDYDSIDVVVHPQSIIHSFVEFVDRSILAQMSHPDMRIPIQYALTYPERAESDCKPLDLAGIRALSFNAPDADAFPCIRYAFEAGKTGGTMPCVLNAANEIAVAGFLAGKIGFMDIPRIIRKKMDQHAATHDPDIDEILAVDARIKDEVRAEVGI